MSNIAIWNNSPGPVSGSTPYGFYDNDTTFQQEAPIIRISSIVLPLIN